MKTSSGFKCPSEPLLPGLNWDHLLNIVHLPVADKEYYGRRIGSYRAELETIGVVVDINGACTMLSFALKSTLSSSSLTCANVFSLLSCINYMSKTMQSQLLNKISCLSGEKWLKTCHGYKSAPESILFNPKWGTVFKVVDLPFVDEAFYGLRIHSYKCELNMLGVVTNFSEGVHIVARRFKLPKEPASLAPEDHLFDARLDALNKYHEKEFLSFLSRAFGVWEFPSPYDYLDIWNSWEATRQVTAELSSFLEQISENWENWDSDTRSILKRQFTMLPQANTSGAVQFVMKEELFITDDFQLKQAFTEASEKPLFAWLPPMRSSSQAKLLEICASLGVRKISEAVQLDLHCTMSANKKIEKTDIPIGKALIKLVLAHANMPMEEKQQTAKSLLELSVYGTEEISVQYALQLLLQKRRIIQMGMALGLEEDAVDSLLWTQNLELSFEDKEFLDRSFPSVESSPILGKRQSINLLLPSTPNASACKR
nr:hypothetical protein CFP56_20095 [Quercus suber]